MNGNIIVDTNFAIGNQNTVPIIAKQIERRRKILNHNKFMKQFRKEVIKKC